MNPSITAEAYRRGPSSTLVGVRLFAHPPDTQIPKPPVHLGLVLDTSGSMEGERLAAVQQTLRVLIAQLADTDQLTLLAFSSRTTVLCEAESDKTRLLACTENLVAEGGTHLESAFQAIAQLPVLPKAFFLLTDGHINQGVRSSEGLGTLLQSVLKARGCPTSLPFYTLGYGEDHAADVLQHLALLTRGSYTYAEASELLPTVVGDMLAAVETVAAEDVHILGGEGSECLELGAAPGSPTFWMGNLIADKPHWVVFDVPPTAGYTMTLRYRQGELSIPIRDAAAENTDVTQQWFRCRVVKALNKARQSLGSSRTTTLVGRLTALDHELETSSVADAPLLLSLRACITDMIKTLEERTVGGAHRMLSNMTVMGNQRGILLPEDTVMAHAAVRLPMDSRMFQSPHQRHVSDSLVSGFSQALTEEVP